MRKIVVALGAVLSLLAAPAAAQVEVQGGPPTPECPCGTTTTTTTIPVHEVTTPGKYEIKETEIPGRWYVGGEFGGMIVEDVEVDIGTIDNALILSHEYGYDGGLFVGYDLGGFRLEAEVAYKKADIESINTLVRLPGEGANFPSQRPFGGGSTSALSFMINGMLDFGDDDGISGFVGGGVGMARVKFNNQRVFANSAPFLDDSDSKLAWQVFAGVRQAISDNIDVTVKYRFFNVDDIKLQATTGPTGATVGDAETRFRSHSLLGGITFRFGGGIKREKFCEGDSTPHALDYQCPVTTRCEDGGEPNTPGGPCPDRRVTETVCLACGRYMVFFDWDRDVITPEAERVLAEVIDAYKAGGTPRVAIAGHADTSGQESYNVELSRRRAVNVRNYLEDRGVPSGPPEAYGETKLLEPTPDGTRNPQNRRVEIELGTTP
jgi:OOP family OmpA-OmpF porin